MKYLTVIIPAFLSILFLSAKPLSSVESKELKTNESVELRGVIGTGFYLSTRADSNVEVFNDSYHLNLKTAVNVLDVENGKKIYEDITNIEIINPYLSEIYNLYGKEVIVIGTLWILRDSGNGYSRQYSTPVFLEVISVEIVQ